MVIWWFFLLPFLQQICAQWLVCSSDMPLEWLEFLDRVCFPLCSWCIQLVFSLVLIGGWWLWDSTLDLLVFQAFVRVLVCHYLSHLGNQLPTLHGLKYQKCIGILYQERVLFENVFEKLLEIIIHSQKKCNFYQNWYGNIKRLTIYSMFICYRSDIFKSHFNIFKNKKWIPYFFDFLGGLILECPVSIFSGYWKSNDFTGRQFHHHANKTVSKQLPLWKISIFLHMECFWTVLKEDRQICVLPIHSIYRIILLKYW